MFLVQFTIPKFSTAEFRSSALIVQLRRRRKLMAFSAYSGSGAKKTLEWNFGRWCFLPAVKPSGPRTVRVVGVGWGTRLGSHPEEKLGREERKG